MVYDEAAVTVINIASPSLSLAGITFKRVTPDGAYTAAFSASAWNRVAAYPVHTLPPGDCYQLRRFGTPLSKPAACDSLQGWLATANQDWHFWIPGEGSSAFRVLRNGDAIQTCQISEGRCVFYLPQP
jgi:hypothetical protein